MDCTGLNSTRISLGGCNPITEKSIQVMIDGPPYSQGVISIYDLSGRVVGRIPYKTEQDGNASCTWTVSDLSSGIYYVQDNSSVAGDIIGVTVLR